MLDFLVDANSVCLHAVHILTRFISYRWGDIEFPLPFGRVMSATESFIHGLDEKVFLESYFCKILYNQTVPSTIDR